MKTIGARIRAVREEKGIEAKDLARRAGLAYSTLMDLENDRQASTTKLHNIAEVLQVRAKWLQTEKGPKEAIDEDYDAPWSDILGYPQAIGLGKGAEAQEYAEAHKLKFRADSLSRKHLNPTKLAVMYGDGDSMMPRIRKGDAILFDTSDTRPRDAGIFVIMWKGEYYAKRCELLDDLVYFKADNPEGDHNWKKPKRMDAGRDHISIIGRVRWIGSWEG